MIDIQVQNLSKIYYTGQETLLAIDNISFHIHKGSFTSIIGQSGSGKTTLLNILAGLDKASSGEILWDQTDINQWKTQDWDKVRNRDIGFVFQNFMLLEEFTVLENVMLPLYIRTNHKKTAVDEAMALLDLIGLSHKKNQYPKKLSGGESQRIAIARAIINKPKLILADEPTGNLDKKNQENIIDLLLKLHSHNKFTFVMVTHNTQLARMAEQTLELSFGKLL